ncbi:hypothetical protein IUK39_03520 [Priestia aryabhattai]|uniref:dUTP diphosphatase n=1 Tax=Priestia aryabhattai TaxID=412384 RepID=UPI001C0BC2C2|nr:dUTP diphosphatase [Priestia aryabhattai]MBU3569247.1 hypothetical protein [Priestia aryabhattai]
MNLTKLFEMQRVLDRRIMDKHPELKKHVAAVKKDIFEALKSVEVESMVRVCKRRFDCPQLNGFS